MNRELIINSTPERIDIALLEDRDVVEIQHEREDKEFLVGDIYLGKVNKTVAGLNAAFVDVGYQKDAFLHYTDLSPDLPTLKKVVKSAIAGNLADPMLADLKYEKQIVKTGKITEALEKKQSLLVQVLKEPISTKGPRLTCEISLPGRYIVLLPLGSTVGVSKKVSSADERKRLQRLLESIKPKNFGIVVRTVAEGKSVSELHDDLNGLLEKWKRVIEKLKAATPPSKIHGEINKTSSILRDLLNDSFNKIVVNDPVMSSELEEYVAKIAPDKKDIVQLYKGNKPIFDAFGITRQIKSLFGKTVTFSGGAYLVLEHTEALHVVDVNSGHKMSKEADQEASALKVNMGAAKEVARQLRLRDIGGIIVIDFIDLRNPGNKKTLYNEMKNLMKGDRARHAVLPLSKFGLMQITRQRTRPEVNITTRELCPTCDGSGKIEASILVTDQIERDVEEFLEKGLKFEIFAHPFIVAYFKQGIPSIALKWSWKYKQRVRISANLDYHLAEYHFIDNSSGEEISLG